MGAIVERCCGLDVHQASVIACLLIGTAGKKPVKVIKTFSAMTRGLMALRDWLLEQGCTVVGMESTGIYYASICNIGRTL